MERFMLQYLCAKDDLLHRVYYRDIVERLLPLVRHGVTLSSCGGMEDPSVYDGCYTGAAWLLGHANNHVQSYNSKTGVVEELSFGVEWEPSALLEMEFYSKLIANDFSPPRSNATRANSPPGIDAMYGHDKLKLLRLRKFS